jgi:BirA family biotin operon repressor/biotin-[acetyl-CoA-carboxylase] ligase
VSAVLAISAVKALKAEFPMLAFGVKWPNDVMCNGKKMGGILVRVIDGVIMAGIGLNIKKTKEAVDVINHDRPVWQATSVFVELQSLSTSADGPEAGRAEEAVRTLDVVSVKDVLSLFFFYNLKRYFSEGFAPFLAKFEELMVLKGERILVSLKNKEGEVTAEHAGVLVGISETGRLLQQLDDGRVLQHSAAEIVPLEE